MADAPLRSASELAQEVEQLRLQLQEADDLITAIRTGSIDALAVQGTDGPRIFTLEGADQVYRTLIEEMNEGALLLTQDGTLVYANASLSTLLDRPLTELIGSPLEPLLAPASVAVAQELLRQGWQQGTARGEVALRTTGGLFYPFSLSLRVLTLPHTAVLGVIATDLSAQREISAIQTQVAQQNARLAAQQSALHAQEAARRAGEQAAAEATRLLEGIPQVAWTTTRWGEYTRFNHRWLDYTGQADSVPHHLWAHVHPADIGAAEARWLHSLRTQEPLELECRIRNAAGDYRWMLGRALPSYNAQGELLEWIGTYTDIDEQKQAERQLQQQHQHLQRVNVDLDTFIYTASHDLKAPISNIEGLLQALQVELPPIAFTTGQVQPILQLMQGAVDRFQHTIAQLTEVSQLQREVDLPVTTVPIAPIVAAVCLDLTPLVNQTRATLQVEVAADVLLPLTEKNARSVVYNLLSNALKYRDNLRVPHVRLVVQQTPEYVVLQVQDNGLGMSETQQTRLFGLFQRLHTHVEGTGVGLYMVKRMVENAGGTITVYSQLGIGSTFTLTFLPTP